MAIRIKVTKNWIPMYLKPHTQTRFEPTIFCSVDGDDYHCTIPPRHNHWSQRATFVAQTCCVPRIETKCHICSDWHKYDSGIKIFTICTCKYNFHIYILCVFEWDKSERYSNQRGT
jgi:hypothetical protein